MLGIKTRKGSTGLERALQLAAEKALKVVQLAKAGPEPNIKIEILVIAELLIFKQEGQHLKRIAVGAPARGEGAR
jgi:hypothetical protein